MQQLPEQSSRPGRKYHNAQRTSQSRVCITELSIRAFSMREPNGKMMNEVTQLDVAGPRGKYLEMLDEDALEGMPRRCQLTS